MHVLVSFVVFMSCAAPPTGSGDAGGSIDRMDGGDGGYGGTMDGGESGIPCVETEWPLSEVAVPVDLAEVWPIFEAWAPANITWERSPIDGAEGTTSSFSVTFAQAGAPVAVTRTGGDPWDCLPGPELRIPVTVTYIVDDGSISGTYVGTIDASGTEPHLVSVVLWDFEPTISEPWADAAEARLSELGKSLDGATVVSRLTTRELKEWRPRWTLFAADHYKDGSWGQWNASLWYGYPDP